jgi:hypothetical protein
LFVESGSPAVNFLEPLWKIAQPRGLSILDFEQR